MVDRSEWDGADRRRADYKLAQVAEDAAQRAVKKTLGMFVTHDLSAKEGREALRADLRHAHTVRIGSEQLVSTVKSTVIKTAVGAAILGLVVVFWDVVGPHIWTVKK